MNNKKGTIRRSEVTPCQTAVSCPARILQRLKLEMEVILHRRRTGTRLGERVLDNRARRCSLSQAGRRILRQWTFLVLTSFLPLFECNVKTEKTDSTPCASASLSEDFFLDRQANFRPRGLKAKRSACTFGQGWGVQKADSTANEGAPM